MSSILVEDSSSSALEVIIHPLIVINIADQVTRNKFNRKDQRVFGGLLGSTTGRRIEIFSSFPFIIDNDTHKLITDVKKRADQCKIFI